MDRYVLVTNASTQLGKELVQRLIVENYLVFACDPTFDNKEFGNLISLNLNPNKLESLKQAKKYIQKCTSKIHAIIHLNSYHAYGAMVEAKEEELKLSLEKNFFEVFRINQEFWDLVEQRSGKIIHDCADVSLFALAPFNGIYSLSKTMLSNYVDILRRELMFRMINVVRVHRGILKDNNFEKIIDKYYNAMDDSKFFYTEINRFFPLNIDKENLVEVLEYTNFLINIINEPKVQPVYYFKINSKLSKINKHSLKKVDKLFRKISK